MYAAPPPHSAPHRQITSSSELDHEHAATRPTRLAWQGLAATTAVIIIAVLARSPQAIQVLEERAGGAIPTKTRSKSDSPVPVPAPQPNRPVGQSAPANELNAARLAGLSALGPLAQKYPNDPAVLKALMIAHASDKTGYASALTVAMRLFEIAPKTAGDDEMRATLLRILAGPTEGAALAFEAVSTKMGPFGADLLFEVANDSNAGRSRERAGKLLEGPEIRKVASPALLIALDLKAASPCKRKDLFERARDEGDARALPLLKPLQATNGCTRMFLSRADCYPCLGNRTELNEAVKAIEARTSEH
jgi:hypothetical protein